MARHLIGYDLALMFGLLAVGIGSRRPSTAMSSVVTACRQSRRFSPMRVRGLSLPRLADPRVRCNVGS